MTPIRTAFFCAALSVVGFYTHSVAAVQIPDSCLGCRFVESAENFRACLQSCLNEPQEPAAEPQYDRRNPRETVNTYQMRSEELYEPVTTPEQKVLVDHTEWTFKINDVEKIRYAIFTSDTPVVYIARSIYPGLTLARTHDSDAITYLINIGPANVLGFENKTVRITFPDGRSLQAQGKSIWDNHALVFHHEEFEALFRRHHAFTITMNVAGVNIKEFKFSPKDAAQAIDWVKADGPVPK
ncbi:MAG: hypothetical protein J6S08_05205 [Duodenibacillus sp.]|nr:hypothetical protein [Duodenibacillus sp.]